jgi:protein SCO1/2
MQQKLGALFGLALGLLPALYLAAASPGRPATVPDLPPLPANASAAQEYFTDVELLDHHGESRRLYSDLLKGHTVVVSPFFTTCTGVCPMLTQKLKALQQRFGSRLGKDLVILTITVDPNNDTVEKLRAYADGFKAQEGWYFLGGKKENVDWALYKLGHYVEEKEAHSNVFIVGKESTGLWKKVQGLSDPDAIAEIVQGVLDDGS